MKQLPNTLTIHVTQRDIDLGQVLPLKGLRSRTCPVARAVNRALRQAGFLNNKASVCAEYAAVLTRRAGVEVGNYRFPLDACRFINAADLRKTTLTCGRLLSTLSPFSFTASFCRQFD